LLRRDVELFNRRDWDGVRALTLLVRADLALVDMRPAWNERSISAKPETPKGLRGQAHSSYWHCAA
jgi:hypothetical protein